ncbi:leucine-rich repeat-containing protein 63-like isoform X2 [Acanthaster planci]|uniref:Leucine-rich repeat-containing protein 63-like isoform X2 n=1 Tax=Acanthaster planci TaxID=133434 RepID=A0A8B7Z8S1_ACAPL|nr:leucine-rich repeat-containing protein 63-like isoform X2 [Acanthaster planci]
MPSHRHSGAKLLRRPLSPPTPPAAKPSESNTGLSRKTDNGNLQSRSLPSLSSLSQDAGEEDDMEELVFQGRNLSPVPSVIPSLASDFQEAQLAPQNTPKIPLMKHSPRARRSHSGPVTSPRVPPLSKTDLPFILDMRYKPRGASAETFRPGSLVQPYKPRGPDGFPFRNPKRLPEVKKELLYLDHEHMRYHLPPDFTLEDFQLEFATYGRPFQRENLKKAILSKQNYKKLTTLFASFVDSPVQEKVNTVELKGEDIPEVVPRVPQHQLLIEMASIIRQQMRTMINEEMVGSLSGPVTTDQPTTVLTTPATAALAYQQAESASSALAALSRQADSVNEVMFNMPVSKYFQGSRRSNSPFNEQDSSTITPSELAILDCLVNGGLALSLKAHFILALPDITPLTKTLTYLNLSFNDFRVFPPELLTLRSLEVLKLRNNPLKELPYDIHRLSKLRTLVVSFNLITALPPSLFTLPLQFLDLSYNKLTFLQSEIRHLRSTLRELNVEGNQLPALPCSALKLRKLRYLRVTNNFMHPLFWKENSQNDPQRLLDLASLAVKQSGLDRFKPSVLPDSLHSVLNRYSRCDCCQGPLYGPGLRVIRPCSKAFGVRKLPFLFTSCSPYCRDSFLTSVESLTQMLYMDD